MKIGTLFTLEMEDLETRVMAKYRCKVIDKNENYLFIDYPINIKTKKTTFFPKGDKFSISYLGADQVVYQFISKIISRVNLRVPALVIRFPDKNKIQRIQRREYVRIETAVDTAVHCLEDSFSAFTTVTTDISGGGLSVIIPSKHTLAKNKKLNIWLVLQMQSGEYNYINAKAELVLLKLLDNALKTASLKFTSITKQSQQNIIQFCFEKQREARKKELI